MSHLLQTITHNKSKYLFIAVILIISSVYVFDRVKAKQQNTCFGQPATIIGTDGDDILEGTNEDDVIMGLGGKDTIMGYSGNDIICGGTGHDEISGGNGDDTILGNGGDDIIRGGRGSDILRGGKGNDILRGNRGFDKLKGGKGNDKIGGGIGDDFLDGGPGNDTINGGKGNDTCKNSEFNLNCEVILEDNIPPIADAGPDQTVFVGDTVQLDGTGSSDADGDTLDIFWSFISRPDSSNATLSNPTDLQPTFVVDAFGNYVLEIIVNDGTDDSEPDTVT
ncbi:MAG: PKD domain-containing protein, partial [Thermodesulfobacteriota bacterium]